MTILLAVRDFPDGCGGFPKCVGTIVELEDTNKNAQHLARRYLPPRKASAVRDFLPLFGGCNDNGKKVGLQNPSVDDNPLKNVAAAADDVKEVKSNIQDDYGRKRKDCTLRDHIQESCETGFPWVRVVRVSHL